MPASLPELGRLAGAGHFSRFGPTLSEPPSSRRFPRQLRLLRPAQFKRVFEQPCRLGNRYLTILARANGLGYPRLGLAISRKHVKTAVERNRIKRTVRESFRHNQEHLGGFDLVIIARPGLGSIPSRELQQILDRQWANLAKRCKDS